MPDFVTIPSRVECIDDARRWVTSRAQHAQLDADGVADVELALTEALANVIEHGYGGDGSHEIRVAAEISDGALRVTVRDWGAVADAEQFKGRDLDDPGEGGYGLFLIEQVMDGVQREPQPDGGTLLTLTKSLATPDETGRS